MGTADTSFSSIIDGLIGREGGYSNNPADKGGPTRWGVTEQVARSYGYKGDMRALPRDTAFAIYQRKYWEEPGFGAVATRYPQLAVELFDIGVNMGVVIAGQFLQRCLNALNQQGSLYPDIIVDGGVGARTLQSLDAYRRQRGAEGGDRLLEAVRCLRGARYIEISEARPANEAFTYGWFGRMVEMAKGLFK